MLYRRVSLLCFPSTNSDLGYRDLGDACVGDLWVCWPCPLSRVPPSPHRGVGEDPSPPSASLIGGLPHVPPAIRNLQGHLPVSAPARETLATWGRPWDPAVTAGLSVKHSRVGGGTPRPCSPYLLQIGDPRFTSARLFPSSVPFLHVHMQVEPPKPGKNPSLGTSQNSDPPPHPARRAVGCLPRCPAEAGRVPGGLETQDGSVSPAAWPLALFREEALVLAGGE